MKRNTSQLVFVMVALASPNKVVNIKESYDVKSAKGASVVTLKSGRKIQDIGYALSSVGELKFKGKSALLFKGVICADCDADLSLFVQPLFAGARRTQFTYPGVITTISKDKNSETTFKTSAIAIRTFFGNCLGNEKSNLINVKEIANVLGKTVEVWNLNDQGDIAFSMIQKESALDTILAQVKSHQCSEINGTNRDVKE